MLSRSEEPVVILNADFELISIVAFAVMNHIGINLYVSICKWDS